jgi:hypothetical protein
MEQPPTCGQGLAQNSLVPGKIGELTAAMAETLSAHMQMLDMNDPRTKPEYETYFQLSNEQRETAARLLATANEMAGARDLPMGRHHITGQLSTHLREAFAKYVRAEQELLALLQQTTEQDETLLLQMQTTDGERAGEPHKEAGA